MENIMTPSFVDGRRVSTCTFSALPTLELEEFYDVELNENYYLSLKKIGDSILFVKSRGKRTDIDISKYYEVLETFIAIADVKLPFIEIRDTSGTSGGLNSRELKGQKTYLQEHQDKFAGIIFIDPPF